MKISAVPKPGHGPGDPGEQAALQRLGANIRGLRERRGMSRVDLAASTELDLADIERMEQGRVWPLASELLRLAGALNATVSELSHGIDWELAPGGSGRGVWSIDSRDAAS